MSKGGPQSRLTKPSCTHTHRVTPCFNREGRHVIQESCAQFVCSHIFVCLHVYGFVDFTFLLPLFSWCAIHM